MSQVKANANAYMKRTTIIAANIYAFFVKAALPKINIKEFLLK